MERIIEKKVMIGIILIILGCLIGFSQSTGESCDSPPPPGPPGGDHADDNWQKNAYGRRNPNYSIKEKLCRKN